MVHGYKYRPGDRDRRATPWLRQLGFGTGHTNEGVAFGWQAQNMLWRAENQSARVGKALAQVLRAVAPAESSPPDAYDRPFPGGQSDV